MEDIEHELLHRVAGKTETLYDAEEGVIGRMAVMLRGLKRHFPVVIFDCPPGLSFVAQAALRIADKVIVPFRPDFVSAFAVDRISRMIERKPDLVAVSEIPRDRRRYIALANCVSDDVAALERIEDIEDYHPLLKTRIPLDDNIASAFNWRRDRVPIETKFGKPGAKVAEALVNEIKAIMAAK